jgi:ATP-binding cassette subfamily G (WHITE) protein 1
MTAEISESGPSGVPLMETSESDNNIPPLPEAERIDVSFSHVDYKLSVGSGKKKVEKHILKDVSCAFKSGRLTVILGKIP